MSKRRKRFLIVATVVVVVGGVAITRLNASGNGATAVRVETVSRRDLVSTVTASGQIEAKTAVDVASDITGRIVRIPVDEGQFVRRGDLLLSIEPTQFEAQVARSEAQLSTARANALEAKVNRDQAKRSLDRLSELRANGEDLVSDEQLEASQQSYDVAVALFQSQEHQVAQAEASLREAREELAKTILRAPIDGKVTRLAVDEGEVALASTFSRDTGLLMTISDLSVILLNVRVDETDVVRLTVGDSAEISVDAYPDTTFVGLVSAISQSAIAAPTGSTGDRAVDYDVEITFAAPPADIRPDLSGTAKIITDTRMEALSIPIIALTVREHASSTIEGIQRDTTLRDTEGVFVIMNGVAQFRPVEVGIAGEEHFEVLAGISAGDSIVAGPYQTIRDLADSTAVRATTTGSGEDVR